MTDNTELRVPGGPLARLDAVCLALRLLKDWYAGDWAGCRGDLTRPARAAAVFDDIEQAAGVVFDVSLRQQVVHEVGHNADQPDPFRLHGLDTGTAA